MGRSAKTAPAPPEPAAAEQQAPDASAAPAAAPAAAAPAPVIMRRQPQHDVAYHVRGLRATVFDSLRDAVAAAAQLSSANAGEPRTVDVFVCSREGARYYGGQDALDAYDKQVQRLRAWGRRDRHDHELALESFEIRCTSAWASEIPAGRER